jgi:hypothetical protein
MATQSTCTECYALVESTTNHQNWHNRLKRMIRDLEDEVERLKRAVK